MAWRSQGLTPVRMTIAIGTATLETLKEAMRIFCIVTLKYDSLSTLNNHFIDS